MEVLIIAGLVVLFGGIALMAISLALGVVIWAVALVAVVVQSLWKAVTR